MEVVELPLLVIDDTLRTALQAMRGAQRSGVVARRHEDALLFTVSEIFAGLAYQKERLSDIAPQEDAHFLTERDAFAAGLDLKDPYRTYGAYESFLDSVGKSYAVVAFGGATATIVTRHEGLAPALLAGPKDCYCLGSPSHSFPPPSVRTGDACSYCNSTIHCE